jgi:glycosyltransferase involved in cell wall biosynthesis
MFRLLFRAVTPPVRVLWLSKGLGPGGAERLLVSLARSMDLERFELSAAYLLADKNHLVPELEAAGIDVVCLDGRGGGQVAWLGRLRKLVRDFRPHVVHIHAPQPAAMARPLLRSMGRRRPSLLYTEHNSWDGYRPPTRVANAVTYPLDDYRLAVSQTAFDSVPKWLRRRMEVLVHGVDLDEVRNHAESRQRVRDELGILPADTLVVTVANLREHKDYPTLLSAARRVMDAGASVRFAAVGQGPLEAQVRADIARLGLDGSFQLLGYRPDPKDVLAAGDIFTLSSLAEGYPVSLMEALALGKPVVATSVGGIPEAVREGVEGLLVPPRRPDLLADAIVRLARSDETRARMGEASLERSGIFDIRRAAARHEELYSVLAGRAGPTPDSSRDETRERPQIE